MSWRTNRRTKNKFRIEGRWGNTVEEEESEEELPSESQYVEEYKCAGCGKIFQGQAYEIENEIVCSECNRIDSKLQRAERAKEAQQPTISYSSVSGSGKHRGGSPSCSKCGHVYGAGESHENHWRLHPD